MSAAKKQRDGKNADRRRALTLAEMEIAAGRIEAILTRFNAFTDKLRQRQFQGELIIDGGGKLTDSIRWLSKCLDRLSETYNADEIPEFGRPYSGDPGVPVSVPESAANTRKNAGKRVTIAGRPSDLDSKKSP